MFHLQPDQSGRGGGGGRDDYKTKEGTQNKSVTRRFCRKWYVCCYLLVLKGLKVCTSHLTEARHLLSCHVGPQIWHISIFFFFLQKWQILKRRLSEVIVFYYFIIYFHNEFKKKTLRLCHFSLEMALSNLKYHCTKDVNMTSYPKAPEKLTSVQDSNVSACEYWWPLTKHGNVLCIYTVG